MIPLKSAGLSNYFEVSLIKHNVTLKHTGLTTHIPRIKREEENLTIVAASLNHPPQINETKQTTALAHP